MGGLNGTRWGSWADSLAAYAEGDADAADTPCDLTPVGGGAAIPFIHDHEALEPRVTEAGLLDEPTLWAMIRQELATGGQYTWDGHTWTVMDVERDHMAGTACPHLHRLVRHAE